MKTNEIVTTAMDNAMMLQEQTPKRLLYFLIAVGIIVLFSWAMGTLMPIGNHTPNKKHISDSQKKD